jgi:WD40 repeat protein
MLSQRWKWIGIGWLLMLGLVGSSPQLGPSSSAGEEPSSKLAIRSTKMLYRGVWPWEATLSPGGERLAAWGPVEGSDLNIPGYEWQLCVWDVKTGEVLFRRKTRGGLSQLAFSQNGKYLVTCGTADEFADAPVWDVSTGEKITELIDADHRGEEPFSSWCAFSPDGELVATYFGDSHSIGLFDAKTWRLKQTIKIQELPTVRRLATFTPDSRYLVVVGSMNPPFSERRPDNANDVLTVWRILDRQVVANIRKFSSQHSICMAFSPSGQWLAIGMGDIGGGVKLIEWNREQPKLIDLRTHNLAVLSLVFTPDNRFLLVYGMSRRKDDKVSKSSLQVWDWQERKQLTEQEIKIRPPLLISPDGKHLFFAGDNEVLRRWELPEALQPRKQ